MIHGGGKIIGKSIAGFLFAITGAPILFIANGISYLLSAFSESFISIPQVHNEKSRKRFKEDLTDGAKYLWNHSALRFFIIIAALQNFTFVIAEVLFLPYFKEQIWLGPEKLGIFEAVSASGALLAMTLLAVFTIPQIKRAKLFIFCFISSCMFMAVVPLFSNFFLMLIFIFGSLFVNAIVNVMFSTFLQRAIPSELRGKVLGFVDVLLISCIPIGLLTGGFLGDIFPIKYVIAASLLFGSVLGTLIIPSRKMKEFLIYN